MNGLTNVIQKALFRFSRFQQKHFLFFTAFILIFTLLLSSGLSDLSLQSDFAKMNPTDPPITKLTGEINTDFLSLNSIVIVIELDDSVDSKYSPIDIRDPEIMKFLLRLDKNLREEISITQVSSLGSIFSISGVPEDIDDIKKVLDKIPQTKKLINSDYSMTLAVVEADFGDDSKKIKEASEKVDEIILQSSPPAGIKIVTTGDAPLGATIFDLIINDAVKTSFIAFAFILILLLIILRSLRKALVILIPLMTGICWNFSILGLLDIAINIGTAGISAMLIGLGVEYGIFLMSRFDEERKISSFSKALETATSSIGASIFSSGGTTIIGFVALSASIFPVLAELGQVLAIGISMLLVATIFITPIAIIFDDKISSLFKKRNNNKKKQKRNNFSLDKSFNIYGKFVSEHPWFFLIFAILFTLFMLGASQNMNNQDIDFETVLPSDLEEMNAFLRMQNEFGDTSTIKIYIAVDPFSEFPDILIDIRDPVALEFIDILSEKAKYVEYVLDVDSISISAKKSNDDFLPKTLTESKSISYDANLISDDFSIALIKLTIDENGVKDRDEVVRQVNELVKNSDIPPGFDVKVIGGLASEVELNNLFGPDSSKTSLLALIGIIIFLFILSKSLKGTFLPLITVFFGVIWTIGFIGLFRVPFNNITSSVITMTIGIGIDFGIQLMNRFNQELELYDKKVAMKNALVGILNPMLITVISAVIGFRAMVFGELNLMGDLGTTMSIAMVACMLSAITGVAALLVILQKNKKR